MVGVEDREFIRTHIYIYDNTEHPGFFWNQKEKKWITGLPLVQSLISGTLPSLPSESSSNTVPQKLCTVCNTNRHLCSQVEIPCNHDKRRKKPSAIHSPSQHYHDGQGAMITPQHTYIQAGHSRRKSLVLHSYDDHRHLNKIDIREGGFGLVGFEV